MMQQMLHDAALDQVLLHNLFYILFFYAGIKSPFRINDNHRAHFAQAKTTGTYNLDFFIQAGLGDLLFKQFNQARGPGRSTPRTSTNQNMRAIQLHV